MVKYSVVIPAYNEETSIEETLKDLKDSMKGVGGSYEIIVVNDASKDKTLDIIKKIRGISVLNHEINKGYGASLKDGIRKSSGEWIIITDADGTYPVKDIPKLLKHEDNNDMVIGARTAKGAKIPLSRRPAKWILRKMSNYITGSNIPDLNSGLRVFSKDMAFKFWNLYPNGFSFTTTITVAAICNGFNVKFVEIDYFKRSGKSSIHPRHFIDFTKLLSKIALYFRPTKVFFPASLFLFIFGIMRGLRDFLLTNSLGDLSVIIIMSALQVLFFGLLAELIVNRNNISVTNM